MTRPAVLNLDDVAVVEVMRLIQAGLVRPGRITNRGAVVYELTEVGVSAFEAFCSDQEALDVAATCREGECGHANKAESLKEAMQEALETLDAVEASFRKGPSPTLKEKLEKLRELLSEE
jgi:hypothetical protein